MNAQKRNHITFEATDGEKEIFKQDCQLQGKTTNRYPHADTAITTLKDRFYIWFAIMAMFASPGY
ncbi:MAG: hypothetical protein ACYTXA_31705 [Nostoc sp.]